MWTLYYFEYVFYITFQRIINEKSRDIFISFKIPTFKSKEIVI